MIKTGLPYSTENMSEIYNNGAEVDMSNIDFPTDQDKFRTTFIYLRNTNFNNITLDFSKCSYEDKEKFLLEYIKSDIIVELFPLIYTWQCLLTFKSCEPYFSNDEAHRFLENNKNVINELKEFYLSLPLYLFTRLKISEMDMEGLEEKEFNYSKNTYYLIQEEFIDYLSAQNPGFMKPILYPNQFTSDNELLFDFMKCLSIYNLIQTMTETSEEDFKNLLTEISKFEESQSHLQESQE